MTVNPYSQVEFQVFSDATDIALPAGQLLEALSIAATEASDDRHALGQWADLEDSIDRGQIFHTNGAEQLRVERFKELTRDFHTALPYSEAERVWLVPQAYEVLLDDGDGPEQIAEREGQIVSAGIRQTVRGRDLMRRWMSWRREADEYAGQNTLGVARSALSGLIMVVEPKCTLPEAYLALVREKDAAQ